MSYEGCLRVSAILEVEEGGRSRLSWRETGRLQKSVEVVGERVLGS
jgi:hypothetical protein